MAEIRYVADNVTGIAHPALYPGEKSDTWVIPEDIKVVFNQLNSIVETKYSREYLKICAFYNKLFPSLKMSAWTRTSYNVPAFTALDQERTDTGTGIATNYLKQVIDQVVSRTGTVDFEAKLLADLPTLEYIVYKDEVERILRRMIRDEELNARATEVFHDAAILGYSHMLIDPFRHVMMKVNDYEAGYIEAQYNRGAVRQFLYRDYSFPVTELVPYIVHCDQKTKDAIIENYGSRQTVDFKMYIDCPSHKVWVVIGGITCDPKEYPFDEVQMETFCWDIGFSKVTTTSLFDLLYPVQRELNRLMNKLQQMLRMYKGAVPVFPADVELAMKAITNGGGEALYVSSTVPVDKLVTVINPTPLDPALSSEVQARKTEMQELAGVQSMSFDADNIRSAATMVALDQNRDIMFQAQMAGMARFIKNMFKRWVNYCAGMGFENQTVDWKDIKTLLDGAFIELKPVHLNDPLGNQSQSEGYQPPDYEAVLINKCVIAVLKGALKFDDLTYLVDKGKLFPLLAVTLIRLQAFGIPIPESAEQFLVSGFVQGIQEGSIELAPAIEGAETPSEIAAHPELEDGDEAAPPPEEEEGADA